MSDARMAMTMDDLKSTAVTSHPVFGGPAGVWTGGRWLRGGDRFRPTVLYGKPAGATSGRKAGANFKHNRRPMWYNDGTPPPKSVF